MGVDLNKAFAEMMVLAGGVLSLALVAIILSKNANTTAVIDAGGHAFNNSILAAISPVTGNYAGSGFSSF